MDAQERKRQRNERSGPDFIVKVEGRAIRSMYGRSDLKTSVPGCTLLDQHAGTPPPATQRVPPSVPTQKDCIKKLKKTRGYPVLLGVPLAKHMLQFKPKKKRIEDMKS